MALLKFLFITILILWLIRMIFRLIFPLIIKNLFSKLQSEGPQGHSQTYQRQQPKKPEGSISIEYMPPQPKSGKTDKLGDFVDYEEVK